MSKALVLKYAEDGHRKKDGHQGAIIEARVSVFLLQTEVIRK